MDVSVPSLPETCCSAAFVNEETSAHPSAPLAPLNRESARGRRAGAILTICLPLVYAGFFRWAFATDVFRGAGGVVSLAFVWSVPFAVGALCVAIGRWRGSDAWWQHALGGPTIVLLLGCLIALFTGWEALMCVVMALPIMLVGGTLGGLLAHWLLPRARPVPRLHLSVAVFLPLIAAFVESSLHWPSELKSIETVIDIAAPPAAIWPEIASVAAIPAPQVPEKWIYRIGFPKPIAATLDREGVGGIRTATFERDVSFFETVTIWEPPTRLSFTIKADPNFIPHTAFDQHIIVGGRFYDVLDGTYVIEPVAPSLSRLHLVSRHRLSTRFNAYAGWWSERVMDQIQRSIMDVIRVRAEQRASLLKQ